LSELFQRVQACEPDRSFVAAELLGRLGAKLGDVRLGRIKVAQNCRDLVVVLATAGKGPQPGRPRSPCWLCTLMYPSAMGELHSNIIPRQ
jgi:hypothetical protein